MAGVLQHLRSSTLNKRPNPASMVDGQIAINYASGSPGAFFKDTNGNLVKVGPVHVGATAPNVSPASGGTAGNSLGEQWLDTSGGTYVFKIWDGAAWRSEAGEFVNSTGDTMTGSLTMGPSANLIFEGSTDDGFETTLTVVDPTADRTITLPNVSGTVVTTGDSGTVTSTMIADGTIVNADVNASAAIAGTKISPDFGSQTIQTTGVFSHAVGSAGAPTITFTGDTNTGIYSPGADQVAISTGGSGRLFVDASGNISAGNSTAFGPLDIKTSAGKRIVYTSLADYASNGIIGLTDGGNETDLGIGGNNLRFFTAAIERLRITSAGLVGVGTSSPTSLLHVDSDPAGTQSARTLLSSSNSADTVACEIRQGRFNKDVLVVSSNQSLSANLFNAIENGTSRFVITGAGNVGIGTSSPQSAVDVLSGVRGVPETSGSTTSVTTLRLRGSSNGVLDIGELSSATAGSYWLQVRDRTDLGYSYNLALQPNGGNVGIGTTSPQELLHVNTGSSGGQVLRLSTNGADTGYLYQNSGAVILGAYSTRILGFETNGTERARIDSSGRLLVGTSSARGIGRLQIEGTDFTSSQIAVTRNSNDAFESSIVLNKTRGTGVGGTTIVNSGDTLGVIYFTGSDGTNPISTAAIGAVVDGTPGANDMPGRLVFSTTADGASSPTERMRISQDGTVGIYNSSYLQPAVDNAVYLGGGTNLRWVAVYAANGTIQTSDLRQKTDIANSSLGAEFIKSLRPVSYKFTVGGNKPTGETDEDGNWLYAPTPGKRTHWGFVAQEVKQAIDDAGVDFGGWILDDPNDPDSDQGLRYDQFIAPLTKALQEALAEIDVLKAKVAALESA